MARSIKRCNEYIIERLNERIKLEDRLIEPLDINRAIKLNKSDRELIRKAKCLSPQGLFLQEKAACFRYKSEYYFVYVGTEKPETPNKNQDRSYNDLIRFSEDKGIDDEEPENKIKFGWTVLVISELKVAVRSSVTGSEIYNALGAINDNYYDADASHNIQGFFEDFHVYKIDSDSLLLEQSVKSQKDSIRYPDISRVLLLYFLDYNPVNNLNFEQKTIEIFYTFAYEGEASIPFDNILDSYLSFSWKYSFLDIYRCLERLFGIPQIFKLYETILPNIIFLNFVNKIEQFISWKPKEEDALKELLNVIKKKLEENVDIFNGFQSVKPKINLNFSEKTQDAVVIYSLRNKIVHFNPKKIQLEESDWNQVISFCLLSTYLLYKKYGEFLRLPDSDMEELTEDL